MQTEIKCPVCKNDSFLNPGIKIYISPCFHKLCEQCLYKTFGIGYAPCPECGTQLRRINFISSTYEDIQVEREIKIRQQLHKTYKFERNPTDLEKYDDWLEEFENLVFELVELKNEKLIKERIKETIADQYHVLNQYRTKTIVTEARKDEPVKKIKISESIFGIKDVEKRRNILAKEYSVPERLFKVAKDSEFTNEFLIDYILNASREFR
ncbi:TFIIH Tfb sub [Enterospora canceri]|uniref:TFIIH Tfb sub n=1 Tax=Enterospora canceri TaxID=1081671 RepID=A0A1Y1SAF1_9MICR|nr:TFIIH Tfb sub [Enterospora canceri]